MTEFEIWAPRWRDKTILLAAWKIGDKNKVVLKDKNFPIPLYVSGEVAQKYPEEEHKAKTGNTFKVRAVPITEFRTTPL